MNVPTDAGLPARLQEVSARIAEAAAESGRAAGDVQLLLATKTQPAERIAAALRAGFTLIGENRVQEISDKADALAPIAHTTHLIGHLQRNKVNAVIDHIDCLQTLDSIELAGRLDRRLAVDDRELDVMLQVNVSGEESKNGVAPDDTAALLESVRALTWLRPVGLMTIGENSPDLTVVRRGYARLRELRDRLLPDGALSMGMSGDHLAAIAEGATLVRLGSAVFGSRG